MVKSILNLQKKKLTVKLYWIKKKIYLALNLFDGVPEYDWLNEYEDYASNLLQYKKAIDDYIVRDYDSNGKAKNILISMLKNWINRA